MKIVLPAADVQIQTPAGNINPTWYEKLSLLYRTLNLFLAHGAYSEGTYTPVFSSAGTVPTFAQISGTYAKVGRLVTVQISASNTAGGTPGAGANQLSISLPLPVASNALTARTMAGSFLNGTATDLAFVDVVAGSATALLWQQTVSGSKVDQVPLNCADFNNVTRAISFAFQYPVN